MARRKPRARAAEPNDTPNSADAGTEQKAPPFFNTTFSMHRVSPLFVGPQGLTAPRLGHLAHRLRDTLVGDVVRGVQIGLEATDTPSGQVGPLQAVAVGWFRLQSILGEAASPDWAPGSGQDGRHSSERGLWIEIRHENAEYVALLLPASSASSADGAAKLPTWATEPGHAQSGAEADGKQFLHLPLLLLRMPQPLKAVMGTWLSTTFDCRVSKLTLGTRTLVNVWEGWISTAGLPSKGPDFVLTVSFNAPVRERREASARNSDLEVDEGHEAAEPGLGSLDISISASDLGRFLRAGQAMEWQQETAAAPWQDDARQRRRLAGGNADDGWAWRASDAAPKQAFTDALARYLDHHLALKLFHPGVRVVQMSCGAFVLAQSRLKIVKLGDDATGDVARGAWMFVTQLGARVLDGSLLSSPDASGP